MKVIVFKSLKIIKIKMIIELFRKKLKKMIQNLPHLLIFKKNKNKNLKFFLKNKVKFKAIMIL